MNIATPVNRLASFAALLLAVGCSSSASIHLHQPRLDKAQQDLTLESVKAEYAVSPEGIARYKITYPLPGATVGNSYYIYLRLPADGGHCDIGSPLPDNTFVGGFLIQTVGRNKGLTEFVSGQIESSRGAMRSGTFHLKCADGSTADGDFRARRDNLELRDFEEKAYPADVAALLRAKSAPVPERP